MFVAVHKKRLTRARSLARNAATAKSNRNKDSERNYLSKDQQDENGPEGESQAPGRRQEDDCHSGHFESRRDKDGDTQKSPSQAGHTPPGTKNRDEPRHDKYDRRHDRRQQ
jgi:hypothetical protein